MRIGKPPEYLGEKQTLGTVPDPLAIKQSLAGPFQADDRITSTTAGRHVIPEHDRAIAAAMKPLYGGLAGKRCDPVEEWPGDHDETYGMPKKVSEGVDAKTTYGEADRDDKPPIITDHPAGKRRVAISDLSGDGSDDPSFTNHH